MQTKVHSLMAMRVLQPGASDKYRVGTTAHALHVLRQLPPILIFVLLWCFVGAAMCAFVRPVEPPLHAALDDGILAASSPHFCTRSITTGTFAFYSNEEARRRDSGVVQVVRSNNVTLHIEVLFAVS